MKTLAADDAGVLVLVPMKAIAASKTRLGEGVDTPTRHAAVVHMFHTVTRAAVAALGPGRCKVIGGDTIVRRLAESLGCGWEPEQGRDLNSSLWLAMQDAYRAGFGATLFLPADLPLIAPADIAAVVGAAEGLRRPAGVPARSDGGTNALLVPAARPFQPRLGLDSFARHVAVAAARGTPLAQVDLLGISFDVDSVEHLEWARTRIDGFESGLEQWRAWLAATAARMGAVESLSPGT